MQQPPRGEKLSAVTEASATLSTGRMRSEIADAIVHIQTEFIGRGPESAKVVIADDAVMVVLRGVLTKAERSLVASGKGETVMTMRQEVQATMRSELEEAIERISRRRVIAFMSANHVDPDVAIEVFLLSGRPEVAEGPGEVAGGEPVP